MSKKVLPSWLLFAAKPYISLLISIILLILHPNDNEKGWIIVIRGTRTADGICQSPHLWLDASSLYRGTHVHMTFTEAQMYTVHLYSCTVVQAGAMYLIYQSFVIYLPVTPSLTLACIGAHTYTWLVLRHKCTLVKSYKQVQCIAPMYTCKIVQAGAIYLIYILFAIFCHSPHLWLDASGLY